MKFNYVIGMDMAKETYELTVHNFDFSQEFINTPKAIRKMLITLKRALKCNLEECLFCFEHTGLYSLEMMVELEKQSLKYSAIPGLVLKKSLGISRGKSDPIDALRIAEYGYMRQDRLTLTKMPSKAIINLKNLINMRAMHVRNRASYESRMNEQFRVLKKTEHSEIFNSQKE